MKETMRVSNTDILLGGGLVEVVNPLEGRGIFRWLRDAIQWRWILMKVWFIKLREAFDA